jgi:ParB/RepB/Spo0J family partition protein
VTALDSTVPATVAFTDTHTVANTTARKPIEGAVHLPINLLRPNRFNPRKHIDKAALNELADSIAEIGVMQAIVAREIKDAVAGEPLYEIVAGERRWRASEIAAGRSKSKAVATIPTIVRELSDFQAMQLAVIENAQREDLHPIEEAEGFHMLLHPPLQTSGAPAKSLTVDELAAKLHKSRSHVFNRLKLMSLTKEARDKCFSGELQPTIAMLIARMPADQQPKALKEVLKGYGGAPMTFREAQEHIRRSYMLELARAPFKITDASLVPAAGSCRECPKRTGANPDLFSDVKNGDVCTDGACFERKVEAEQERKRLAAADAGMRIVDKTKAGEYLRLNEPDYSLTTGGKTIGQLLGKNSGVEIVMIETSDQGLVPAVKTADAKEALKSKGVLRSQTTRGGSDDYQRKIDEASKAGTAWRRAVAIDCLAALADPAAIDGKTSLAIVRLAAEAHYCRMESDNTKRMHALIGSEPIDANRYNNSGAGNVRKAVAAMSPEDLIRFLAAMAISTDLYLPPHYTDDNGKDTRLAELATLCKVDLAKVRTTILAERKAATKAKPKSKAKAAATPTKRAAAKGKAKPAKKAAAKA